MDICIINPFSDKYHACADFKKLTRSEKTKVLVATFFVSLLSLFLFGLPAVAVFRSLIGRFRKVKPEDKATLAKTETVRKKSLPPVQSEVKDNFLCVKSNFIDRIKEWTSTNQSPLINCLVYQEGSQQIDVDKSFEVFQDLDVNVLFSSSDILKFPYAADLIRYLISERFQVQLQKTPSHEEKLKIIANIKIDEMSLKDIAIRDGHNALIPLLQRISNT